MIARTGKDIEVLIDSLPGEESTAELQAAGLRELEQESEVAGEQLRQTVKQGEQLLSSLQVPQRTVLTLIAGASQKCPPKNILCRP